MERKLCWSSQYLSLLGFSFSPSKCYYPPRSLLFPGAFATSDYLPLPLHNIVMVPASTGNWIVVSLEWLLFHRCMTRLPREMLHSGRRDLHSFSHQIAWQRTHPCCSVTTHEKSCRPFLFARFAIKWAVDVSSTSLYSVCSVLSVEMQFPTGYIKNPKTCNPGKCPRSPQERKCISWPNTQVFFLILWEKTECCHITLSIANLKNGVSLSFICSTIKKEVFFRFLICKDKRYVKPCFSSALSLS